MNDSRARLFQNDVRKGKRYYFEVTAGQHWGREVSLQTLRLLVDYRKELQIPASHVAEQMGIAPEIIYRLELCKRDPKLSTILRYARCLGLDIELCDASAADDV